MRSYDKNIRNRCPHARIVDARTSTQTHALRTHPLLSPEISDVVWDVAFSCARRVKQIANGSASRIGARSPAGAFVIAPPLPVACHVECRPRSTSGARAVVSKEKKKPQTSTSTLRVVCTRHPAVSPWGIFFLNKDQTATFFAPGAALTERRQNEKESIRPSPLTKSEMNAQVRASEERVI